MKKTLALSLLALGLVTHSGFAADCSSAAREKSAVSGINAIRGLNAQEAIDSYAMQSRFTFDGNYIESMTILPAGFSNSQSYEVEVTTKDCKVVSVKNHAYQYSYGGGAE